MGFTYFVFLHIPHIDCSHLTLGYLGHCSAHGRNGVETILKTAEKEYQRRMSLKSIWMHETNPSRWRPFWRPVSCPSSCVTRSHMVTLAPLSEFPVSHISNHNWNPRLKWMWWVWEKLLFIEGAILNAFYPLVISETFTLVPFRFFVPVLQIYMYLVLLTW